MKILSTIVQWIIIIAVIAACVICLPGIKKPDLHLQPITGFMCILFSLSFAFWWVEILRLFKTVKPFNCLKCMTGWVSLIVAVLFHVPDPYMYLFIGLFVGAITDQLKQRL
jgi:hypothetical protein